MSRRVYMDHSATTPVRNEVVEAMLPYFTGTFGNASSVHGFGREARQALDRARETVASCIGAQPEEIIFTSGGTESDNLAVKGAALANPACLRCDTCLVSIMLANNEVGVVEPIAELSAAAGEAGGAFHTDAVQACGKMPVNVRELGVDLLTMSAHKFYGPKGVGVLYRRKGVRIEPMMQGGHHEKNLRAGTENVAGIVGLAEALRLACAEMPRESERLARLRDRLQGGILSGIADVRVNGHLTSRLPHIVNVSILGVEGESMLLGLDARGIAVSTGSACTSGSLEPSHVLTAMGIPPEVAHGSLRFSLGLANTEEDVDYVLDALQGVVQRLREMSPTYLPAGRQAGHRGQS